jgi:hypothetical protein
MSSTEEKIEAILKLDFLRTARELDTYLGLTGYLRQYVNSYALKAEPL